MRYLLFVIGFFFIIGCSSGVNPITPSSITTIENNVPVVVEGVDGEIVGGAGALGIFQLNIDPKKVEAEIINLRNSNSTDVVEVVDITNFLTMTPCSDCVKINAIGLDSNGNIILSIGIKHPFPAGNSNEKITGRNRADLHVFNVEGIVASDSSGINFPMIGKTVDTFLLNADGYTGYLDEMLDSFFFTSANIHPYILHFDDYSIGNFNPSNPMGFESVTNPPPVGNLVMAMGSDYDFKDYIFEINDQMEFIYVVGCTYGVSTDSKSQRFNPEYRVPQHNKKAPSEVWVQILENNLQEGNVFSSAKVRINVVDISHGVSVGSALNQMRNSSSVANVLVEIPGVTTNVVSAIFISGAGRSPSDPLIYEANVSNAALAVEGIYNGLVKVLDSYSPGINSGLAGDGIERVSPVVNPVEGFFSIPEFATYQVFNVDIGEISRDITITSPAGEEDWGISFDKEITWTSSNIEGDVKVEYSKDNFISDINLIVDNCSNDGTYLWENIPNDPSDTVRIRISSLEHPSVMDISNEFSIIFVNFGWVRTWGSVSDDFSHAVVADDDGVYILGSFQGTVDFDPDPDNQENRQSNGKADIFLSKFDTFGSFDWVLVWGGLEKDEGLGLVTDSDGVYVTGYCTGNPYPGGSEIDLDPSGGEFKLQFFKEDFFLSKFSSSGSFVWATKTTCYGTDARGNDLAIDSSGVYVVGSFSDRMYYGSNYVEGNLRDDVFVAKYLSSNLQWVKHWGGSQKDCGQSIVASDGEGIYTTGRFIDWVDFDPSSATDWHYSGSSSVSDTFVSKLNPNGDFCWAKTWGNSSSLDQGNDIAFYNSNIYVTGIFMGTVDFDPNVGVAQRTSNGLFDIFLNVLDSNGDFQWVNTWGGIDHDFGYAIDINSEAIYLGGFFSDSINFGNGNIFSNGEEDAFILKLNNNGDFQWVNTFGGDISASGYSDMVRSISIQDDNIYTTGLFLGDDVDFDPGIEEELHDSAGGSDVFLIKYLPGGSW